VSTHGPNPAREPYQPLAWLAKALPELSVALTTTAILLAPQWPSIKGLLPDEDTYGLGLMADGATLLASATLMDIASRLQRPPPWWIVPLAPIGLLLFAPDLVALLVQSWALGWLALLPLVWSIGEKLRELWTLPNALPIEKLRRRTLVFDRLYTALVLGVGAVATALIASLVFAIDAVTLSPIAPWLIVAFYAINAGNAWRVHQVDFARRPSSLWPWIDQGQATDLS
jgi:hypothetical protein